MNIIRSKIKYLPTIIFIVAGVFVWVLSSSGAATADTYSDSAHGNDSSGVNRSNATCENWPGGECVTGSCAHCHDTFDPNFCGNDPNGLMLFAPNDNPTPTPQTDNFCFQCHKGSGSVQVRDGGFKNYTYSTNFGGGTPTFTNIYDAFNPTTGDTPSSHNLADVLNHAVGRNLGFTSDTNPCLVCHDHHAAQQNYPVTLSGFGGVKTAIRLPIDYNDPPANLWGDEDATSGRNERMSDYTGNYQAPYYKNVPHDPDKYEPANDDTGDGSNLPNFKKFCISECHMRDDVYSTERQANLMPIDWETAGDQHGKSDYDDGEDYGYTVAPYDDEAKNYVLACTDCHEPHGSENEWLLRTCVNGKDNISVPAPDKWWQFCTACHVLTLGTEVYHQENYPPGPPCRTCHYHNAPGYSF
jgi:hypothetical protein